MAVEHLVRRIIWQAKCTCERWSDTKANNPPRERQCPECGEWVPYEEIRAESPEWKHGQS